MRRLLDALVRAMRRLAGLDAGQAMSPLLIGLYTFFALSAIAIAIAWLTDTPLSCITGGCGP